MRILKPICQKIFSLLKQAWLLPHAVALAGVQRRQQSARAELEVERLDRIRNPSKYRGR
jgi:hypothetical protein